MNYCDIKHDDMLNGDGIRVTLFVSGCNHACENCQNPETWDENAGVPFKMNDYMEICAELDKDYISGITFSGGDPLYPNNRSEIRTLINNLKIAYPEKNIWLYTGYLYEDIKDEIDFLDKIDVLVDGPFIEAEKDLKLHWVGSANQRVIDMKKTLQEGKVILYR